MRVGGQAEWLLEPADPEQFAAALVAAREHGGPVRILGGGANVIPCDGILPGVVIATSRLNRVFRPPPGSSGLEPLEGLPAERAPAPRDEEARLVAWAGASLPALVAQARDLGWSGLEGLIGVPGQLGGGVAMNAGGRWGELWDVVERVRVLDEDGRVLDLERSQCRPRYRDGNLGRCAVVCAVLRLAPATVADVRERGREYLQEKKRVQPVAEWSAGCVFKNPPKDKSAGRSAGQLIEACGLKGLSRGDAQVSPLHANFIVNRGHATASDVLALIDELRARVAERTGLVLEGEAKLWTATQDPQG
jgi:UDP-N-acetylmuramate dehydrogenase